MSAIVFGVNVSGPPGAADPVARARQADALGFDFVSASDHLHGDDPTFEPWTTLSWIAAVTTRVRVLTRVLAVPYRHPAVVAKMAETLDRLSGGRLILGLGGGYSDDEFRAFGVGERTPRDKVDGLDEAIRIVRGLWSEPSLSFHGRHYRVEDARVEPKPDHHVPIWLGTYGPRALAVTGRLADGWIPTLEVAPPDRIEAMRDRVLSAAAEAGRDPGEITLVYNVDVRVDERADLGPTVVSGPPDAVIEQLVGFTALGFRVFSFLPAGPDTEEQLERLAREVIPAVRAASPPRS
jgi:probable F420-dependent oxidoreductase